MVISAIVNSAFVMTENVWSPGRQYMKKTCTSDLSHMSQAQIDAGELDALLLGT